MKDEITEFFGNIENTNDFSIRKWINSETNNLDINMFCALSTEFNKYCIVRAIAQVTAPKKNNEFTKQLNEIRKNDNDFFNSFPLNYYKIEDNTIQYNRTTFKNGKIDFDYRDLISELSSFQNIMHELFEIIKSKETTEPAPPQQLEDVKNYEVKKELHNDIFKHNAFEVFEIYKENKEINVNSRTDLRVIFELLKGDNLLLKTIELKHYIDWLNRVYYDGNITELKKQNLNSKPNIVRTNDYNAYKKTTLKQP